MRTFSLAGFAASLATVLLFWLSLPYTFGYLTRHGGVLFASGLVSVATEPVHPYGLLCKRRTPEVFWMPTKGGPFVSIPLWMPFVVIVVVSVIAWRRNPRGKHIGCRKCGYDLTGNASGACPECGTPIKQT